MQDNIHPKLQDFKITMCDGSVFVSKTAGGADHILLESDIKTHPAWRGGGIAEANVKDKNIAKFMGKFGSIGMLSAKKTEDK